MTRQRVNQRTLTIATNTATTTAPLVHAAYEHLDWLEADTLRVDATSVRQDDGSRSTGAPSQPLANVIAHDWIHAKRWHLNRLLDLFDKMRQDVDELAAEICRLEQHRPDGDDQPERKASSDHVCNQGVGKKLEGWAEWQRPCANLVTDNEIIDGMCPYCTMRMNKWRTDNDLDPISRDSLDRHYRHPHRARNGRFTKET